MQVNGISNQSFGKLYGSKEDINAELKKIKNPQLRHVARKAVKSMDSFNYYDMYIGNGEIKIIDKSVGEDFPIQVKTLSKGDKGVPFYSALKYIFGKESLDSLTDSITNGNPSLIASNGLVEKLETILKNSAIYGTLKTMQAMDANGLLDKRSGNF